MPRTVSRRESLRMIARTACASACASWSLGCSDDRRAAGVRTVAPSQVDASLDEDASNVGGCVDGPPVDTNGWVAVPLDALPALQRDGASEFDDDAALLHVWVLDDGRRCYRAVWRVCTHGSCEVVYDAASRGLVCPCHGSRFARDGSVMTGPATVALRTLDVRRNGDTLFIERPFSF